EEDEDIDTVFLTPEELETAIREGQPVDAKTIASFFLARSLLM
ncbi:MAG: NUDIX hydrolase, partial [Sphaerospermopsis kisseleviana]